jgi:hypothetical protein
MVKHTEINKCKTVDKWKMYKNYIIILEDAEKVFDKNPLPLQNKSPEESKNSKNTHQHHKGSLDDRFMAIC